MTTIRRSRAIERIIPTNIWSAWNFGKMVPKTLSGYSNKKPRLHGYFMIGKSIKTVPTQIWRRTGVPGSYHKYRKFLQTYRSEVDYDGVAGSFPEINFSDLTESRVNALLSYILVHNPCIAACQLVSFLKYGFEI